MVRHGLVGVKLRSDNKECIRTYNLNECNSFQVRPVKVTYYAFRGNHYETLSIICQGNNCLKELTCL